MSTRRRHSAEFKTKVTLEVLKGQRLANEIAGEFGVHPTVLSEWKKLAVEGLPSVFAAPNSRKEKESESEKARLYQQIGQLKVELDWLRKISGHH